MNLDIKGAKILAVFDLFGFEIVLTEAAVNTWIVMAVIAILCVILTRGMSTRHPTKRQRVAEYVVKFCNNLVYNNMGEGYAKTSFPAFAAAILGISAFSSLSSLFSIYPPTADLSTVMGWAILVFIMITYTKIKTNGVGGYLKGFTQPIVVMTPMNLISEVATPVSMAFRHFGNIAAGQVITALLYAALMVLNNFLFGWIDGVVGALLAHFPIAAVGIPAVLSIYFDVFTSCIQAYIFCMLTMSYIRNATE